MNDFLSPAIRLSIAELAVAGITCEYPHKLDHVHFCGADAQAPRSLHPAFYGCYDWHSAVHSHWTVLKLLDDPAVTGLRPALLECLHAHFSAAALGAELAYVRQPGRQGFERPYGWAWFWALQDAVRGWERAQNAGTAWSARLAPIGEEFMARWLAWLARQSYPCRQGTHANTAFALSLALDHARALNDEPVSDMLVTHALRLYAKDEGFTVAGEPSANDFLSPVLAEAAMLSRCMTREAWLDWWSRFMPQADGVLRLPPARVDDREDAQGVHLDGLNLSRAWHAAEIARFLGTGPDARPFMDLAVKHWHAGIQHLRSGDFLGEHWLGTFALAAGLALSEGALETPR